MTNWFNQHLVWDMALAPNQSMTFDMNDMLFEGIFGRGKHVADLSVVKTIV